MNLQARSLSGWAAAVSALALTGTAGATTAAHCVYGSTYASKIAFVHKYHSGKQPYGAWPVRKITVAAGWRNSHDQNLDFAFLAVAPPAGTRRPVQRVTGGLRLGINLGYSHQIKVIGYNNGAYFSGPARRLIRQAQGQ